MPALDFDQIYRDHVQQVARWAAWLVGKGGDPEDVVQDVFVTAHRLLPTFRGDAALSTWLFRLTQNASRHHRRRATRRRWLRIATSVIAPSVEHAPSPERLLASSQELALVQTALEGLPEKYRTVLILSRLEGLSGEQIAALTETKLATVWVHLHRARAELATRYHKLRRASHGTLVSPETPLSPDAPLSPDTKQLGGPT
jgi:RNA polymerase sigma-70 factor, ECF subfamily